MVKVVNKEMHNWGETKEYQLELEFDSNFRYWIVVNKETFEKENYA